MKQKSAQRPRAETKTLRIESIAAGGDGVAHDEGRAVFVAGAAPGDLVEVAIEPPRGGTLRGRALRVIERGPGRVEPPCRFWASCGGCDFMHLSAEAQSAAHRAIVEDALRRIAGLEALPEVVSQSAHEPHEGRAALAYRTRARVHARVYRGRLEIGFRAAASHAIAAIDHCVVLVPKLDALLGELPEILAGARGDGEISIALGQGDRPIVDVVWRGSIEPATWAKLDKKILVGEWAGARLLLHGANAPAVFGDPRPLLRGADGAPLVVAAGGFAQPSDEASILLARRAAALAQKSGDKLGSLLELYAGSGTLSILLAPLAARFVAVESEAESAAAARQNLAARGLAAKVVCADAASFEIGRPDVVVLDPPRSGAREATARIAASPARAVVYVACEPTTMARDVAVLVAAGFTVSDLETVEIFPQTSHIETLVRLVRHRPGSVT